jgi:hypothetical protein
MRSYWLKILLGACAIFVVGYAGVYGIRKSKDRIRSIAESSDPVSIPLAFLPFTLDGVKSGTFKGIRLDRDAPKSLNSITLRVNLADSADAERIKACLVTLEGDGHEFDPSRGFRCLKPAEADSAALVAFGEVYFSVRHGENFSVPLMLDSAVVSDLRESGSDEEVSVTVGAEAEAAAEAAVKRADSITKAVNQRVDSIVRKSVPQPPKPRSPSGNPG